MNVGLLACLFVAGTQSSGFETPRSGLLVDVSASRSASAIDEKVEEAVRKLARQTARLTSGPRQALVRAGIYNPKIPFSLPTRVRLAGVPADRSGGGGGRGVGDITLVFDSAGARSFPPSYQTLLTDTFARAKATIGVVFGAPSESGNVHVRNFDADIGDRDAVVGGYYIHNNGSGEREIRFPIYASPEAAAVNFVHCLLLAYLGDFDYGFDAFTEGIVRAAVMRIARTSNALPASLIPVKIEEVLDNTYDVGTFYDWFNQRALGGSKFIAPNLLNLPLPIGGSLGGIYLARYQMAGSAWQKALVEYPGFAAAFNAAFYGSPGLQGDVAGLSNLAQQTLDSLGGSANATIEGKVFSEWFRRQHILETRDTLGTKLLVQPIPLSAVGGSVDFGVFDVVATWFETRANGDEILLGGISYPIFWTPNYDRIFPDTQSEVMPIAGAYGSVATNIPSLFSDQPYRCSIDIPVQDRISRTYVPAGAISTGSNPTPRDFYGTVLGVEGGAGVTIRVRLTIGSTVFDDIAVTNGAFGTLINQPIFLNSARLRIEVVRRELGLDSVMIDRLVTKGPGSLAVDLRVNDGERTFAYAGGLPKGLALLGMPVDPLAHTIGELLGISEDQVLAARYNPARAAYDIYPNTGMFRVGNGMFVRTESAIPGFAVTGRVHPGTAVAVALRPGWNLISNPLSETVPFSDVIVAKAADFPKLYADALGVELGTTIFQFNPGVPDAATGAPETGTLNAATQFEAGKGYFVRVLVPEGVTLLFEPTTLAAQGRAPLGGSPPPPPDWKLGLKLEDGPYTAQAYVGLSRTATSVFDSREDSGLPPSLGGMQLSIEGTESLYQDMRRTGTPTTFKVKAQGLIPGKLYRLRMEFLNGTTPYTFTDPTIGAGGIIRQNWRYTFRAFSSSRVFEIIQRGGR